MELDKNQTKKLTAANGESVQVKKGKSAISIEIIVAKVVFEYPFMPKESCNIKIIKFLKIRISQLQFH